MRKYIKYGIALFACGLIVESAMAQDTESGYFVDEYTYRYQMNPAMGNKKGFVSMPIVGNVNVDMKGNLGLKDVLYNINGRTCLFTNPGVSTTEFMNNITSVSKINTESKIGIMSVGFNALGGYNTISINAREATHARVPKAIFSLLKEGVKNGVYDISDLNVEARAFAEIALNHSHEVSEEWRVGGTVKFLIGLGDARTSLHRAKLTLNNDTWDIETNAELIGSVKGLKYKTTINENTGKEYVNGAEIKDTGINGFGAAIDFGAVYKPFELPDWEFSIAVLDLGLIHWNNTTLASTNGTKRFSSSEYTFNVDKDADNSLKNEWHRMRDALCELYQLDDMGNIGYRNTYLAATLNAGMQYRLPVYDRLSFGLLNTTRINGKYTWTNFRLSANIAPCDVFSAGVNAAVGTYGTSFGWLANLHVTGFNLFLGMDHTIGKLAKQGVPLGANTQANVGINFLF